MRRIIDSQNVFLNGKCKTPAYLWKNHSGRVFSMRRIDDYSDFYAENTLTWHGLR